MTSNARAYESGSGSSKRSRFATPLVASSPTRSTPYGEVPWCWCANVGRISVGRARCGVTLRRSVNGMTERTEVERLDDQLERAFEGESWHGSPIFSALSGISAGQAASRPLRGTHSIWELVNHVAAWLSIVRCRAGGEAVYDIPDEMDWPPAGEASESAWEEALADLGSEYGQLRALVEQLSDADLENRVEGKLREYTVYQDLHGVIQHSLYHVGQIALLAKAAVGDGD